MGFPITKPFKDMNTPPNKQRPPKAKDVLKEIGYSPVSFDTNEFLNLVATFFRKRGVEASFVIKPLALGEYGADVSSKGFYYPTRGDIVFRNLWQTELDFYKNNFNFHDLVEETERLYNEKFKYRLRLMRKMANEAYKRLPDLQPLRKEDIYAFVDTQYCSNAVALLKISGYNVRSGKDKYIVKLL